MVKAAQLDSTARSEGKPAMHKLKLLPSVTQLLSRNSIRENIVDPDTNLLEAVKFFLEPLEDGSLPAYNIQRDLFSALLNLPIGKEALISSGIGKVTLFYTKSKRPEQGVKRMAERLISEWSRPILKRSDDYHQKRYETKDYVQPYAHLLYTSFLFLHLLALVLTLFSPYIGHYPTAHRLHPRKSFSPQLNTARSCLLNLHAIPTAQDSRMGPRVIPSCPEAQMWCLVL